MMPKPTMSQRNSASALTQGCKPGFSKPHKDAILSLRSGMPLTYHDHCLCLPSTGRDIAQLSIKMKEKLGKWELKGYKVTAARIRFIVAWKSKDAPRDEKESAIVLADLVMKKC